MPGEDPPNPPARRPEVDADEEATQVSPVPAPERARLERAPRSTVAAAQRRNRAKSRLVPSPSVEPAASLWGWIEDAARHRQQLGDPSGAVDGSALEPALALARDALRRGQHERAITAVARWSAEAEARPDLALELARIHVQAGDFAGARRLLDLVPQDLDALPFLAAQRAALRGLVLLDAGELSAAERHLTQARHGFAGRPVSTASLELLVAVSRAGGLPERTVQRLEEAAQVFQRAGDLSSARWSAFLRAELLTGLGRGEEARGGLEQLLVAAAAEPPSWLGEARGVYAALLSIAGEADAAEEAFHRGQDTGRVQAWFAVHLMVARRPDDAVEAALRTEHPLAMALLAVLRRDQPPVEDDEAFLLWRALEAWRAGASVLQVEPEARKRASVAVQMVLAAAARRRKIAP